MVAKASMLTLRISVSLNAWKLIEAKLGAGAGAGCDAHHKRSQYGKQFLVACREEPFRWPNKTAAAGGGVASQIVGDWHLASFAATAGNLTFPLPTPRWEVSSNVALVNSRSRRGCTDPGPPSLPRGSPRSLGRMCCAGRVP
jgi:hypothetical protein